MKKSITIRSNYAVYCIVPNLDKGNFKSQYVCFKTRDSGFGFQQSNFFNQGAFFITQNMLC